MLQSRPAIWRLSARGGGPRGSALPLGLSFGDMDVSGSRCYPLSGFLSAHSRSSFLSTHPSPLLPVPSHLGQGAGALKKGVLDGPERMVLVSSSLFSCRSPRRCWRTRGAVSFPRPVSLLSLKPKKPAKDTHRQHTHLRCRHRPCWHLRALPCSHRGPSLRQVGEVRSELTKL